MRKEKYDGAGMNNFMGRINKCQLKAKKKGKMALRKLGVKGTVKVYRNLGGWYAVYSWVDKGFRNTEFTKFV